MSKALQLCLLTVILSMFLIIETLCSLPLNMNIQINAENSNHTEHMEISHKIHKSINQGDNGSSCYFNTLTVITSSKCNCKMQFSAP